MDDNKQWMGPLNLIIEFTTSTPCEILGFREFGSF